MTSSSNQNTEFKARFRQTLGTFTLDVDTHLPAKGVTALFGPSGCGKTTFLRCLAGLEKAAEGSLTMGGKIWQDQSTFLPTHKRPIGYIFQEASLFPHLTVRDNLNYGMNRSKETVNEGNVEETANLLGLNKLLDRHPDYLSGGERQRVALGRALLTSPRILLMDEPLSALDQMAKEDIIPYLEELRRTLSIPIVFVSHDIREVERLADHMVLMDEGRITASGPLIEMLSNPALPFAQADQTASILEGSVVSYNQDEQLTEISVEGHPILVPGKIGETGESRRIRIAASDISLSREKPSETTILNVLPAVIQSVEALEAGRFNIFLGLGQENQCKVIARISSLSQKKFAFAPDQTVYLQIKGVSMIEKY